MPRTIHELNSIITLHFSGMRPSPRPGGAFAVIHEVKVSDEDGADIVTPILTAIEDLKKRYPKGAVWLPSADGLRVWRSARCGYLTTRVAVADPARAHLRTVMEYAE